LKNSKQSNKLRQFSPKFLNYKRDMQKNLVIIRHAKAKEMKDEEADFDRELHKKGISHANMMGRLLKNLHLFPDKIYSSPALRTQMTAEIFAEVLGYEKGKLIFEQNIYEASTSILLEIVNNFDESAHTVFLVGHNPGLTLLADYLCSETVEFIPTTGMVYITFEVDTWKMLSKELGQLVWLKSPKEIEN
jgi:phosphohistidine phosphatase